MEDKNKINSQNTYPWYDSVWLQKYKLAFKAISEKHPQKLKEFIHAFDGLKTRPDFKTVKYRSIFEENTLAAIREVIKSIRPAEIELHELKDFRRFIMHNHPDMTNLQHSLIDLVSEGAGEKVEPAYNFLCLYRSGGICKVHMDAPEAKWTLDVCIEQDEPWPIHLSQVLDWPEDYVQPSGDWEGQIKKSSTNQFESFSLDAGEAILFSGSSQWHYRDLKPILTSRSTASFCNLIFFHFIPAGMSEIVNPSNWYRLFGVPELVNL
jgi:hypothetical protein